MMSEENKILLETDRKRVMGHTKGQIFRTLGTLCFIWIFAFTAFAGLQNLESSINPDIGVYSLASITGFGLISCILAPAIIGVIGAKGSLVCAGIGLSIFVASNYYPEPYVLIPGAVIYGFTSGLQWTAQGTYVTTLAVEYSSMVGEDLDTILGRFFGIFIMAFQTTQIWGNLLSSFLLEGDTSDMNNTRICGAEVCFYSEEYIEASGGPPERPSDSTLYSLVSVYLGCSVTGLLITLVLLKPIPAGFDRSLTNIKLLLGDTLKLLVTDGNMMMLVPVAIYSGVEQVVMFAEFTRAYVSCELGVSWVGYTMVCYGVANTIASPLNGILTQHVGRPLLYVFAFISNVALLVLLRLWQPNADDKIVFFVIPAAWALGDAIWQTQNSALIGSAFTHKKEAGFGNLRMFEASGFCIAYLYSNSLCVDVKLYIVGGLLLLSFSLLMVVEYRLKVNRKCFKYEKVRQYENEKV